MELIETDTNLLKEAKDIAKKIIDQAITSDNGITWKTTRKGYKGEEIIEYSESLYDGTTGISYFLLQLYKVTEDTTYLEVCEQSIKWLNAHCKNKNTLDYSLYRGRFGVVWL